MKFLVPVIFAVSTTLFAANPFLGTWKLNTAKSKSTPMPLPRSLTVVFEVDGEKIKRTATGVDAAGKPILQGSPAGMAWDGNDHPIPVPNGPPMTVAVKSVSDYHNDVTVKRNGEVAVTIRSVVSKDGRTMTNTVQGVNEKGETFHVVEVLEKQ
jgi:hypothetical protein